jgi:hypothetical protein
MMAATGIALAAAALALAGPAPPRGEVTEPLADEVAPQVSAGPRWKLFPIPMYTTVPTEGSTYGVMPVLMAVNADGEVRLITAPSASWNSAAGVTGTVRLYLFPNPVRVASLIASASTHVNRTIWITYNDLPIAAGRMTWEIDGMLRRNIFYRFFGLGADSLESNQSSYTRTTARLSARWGLNLPAHFNVGVRGSVRGDHPIENPIFGLPATQVLFPAVAGLGGAGVSGAELSVRFDTRSHADYSDQGVASELRGAYVHALTDFDDFWQVTWHTRALWPEARFLQGAARLYWTDEIGAGADTPFFYQAMLGGEGLLRGFPEDRFIDRAAWEAEVEQRIRVWQSHIFDVTTDWRLDPFAAIGQVYGALDQAVSHPQLAVGMGLRAWVRPNVLGRVDLAYASEGLNAYIVLGYPY